MVIVTKKRRKHVARIDSTRIAIRVTQATRATLGRFLSKLAEDCWRSAQLVVFFVVAAGTFAVPPSSTSTAFAALQSFEARIVELHAALIERVAFLPDLPFPGKKEEAPSVKGTHEGKP
jgi:hypothetical protein